jgi:hypothetical protein
VKKFATFKETSLLLSGINRKTGAKSRSSCVLYLLAEKKISASRKKSTKKIEKKE